MMVTSKCARFLNWLLLAAVVGGVVVLPVRAFADAGNASAVLETKAKKSADSEKCGELQFDVHLFAFVEDEDVSFSSGHGYGVGDDSVETESVLGSAHLERGPPRR